MLYVGIDVAKNKHDMAILNQEGEVLLKHLRFENNASGFAYCHQSVQKLLSEPNEVVQIAMEDTGHYAYNLIQFLHQKQYQIITYNPLLIKEFVKSQSLRKTKTDKKDAFMIACKLLTDFQPRVLNQENDLEELKWLTRHRFDLVQKRSQAKVQYTKVLDLVFPELAKIINTHNKSIYELLKKYPTAEKISRARKSTVLNHKHLDCLKAEKIYETSQHSIGQKSPALAFELKNHIEMIETLTKQIKKIEGEIEHLMQSIDSPITSITGIGTTLGAIILAEIRSIHNFKTPAQLQAFAGLEPSIYQSGQMDNQGRMVKRGSTRLRYALIQAAKLCANFSPKMGEYLALKRRQGKHYNVAISHVAKKLIRILFYLLKNNKQFDEACLV